MSEIEYKISTYKSDAAGYQSKKGLIGIITVYISTIWKESEEWALEHNDNPFELFVDYINIVFIHERYCLERAFQKIKTKGGMCNPCCVMNSVDFTTEYLFSLSFKKEVQNKE